MSLAERLHECCGRDRRVRVLSEQIQEFLPTNGRVLDVGSGDGRLAMAIRNLRDDLFIEGIDVAARAEMGIPVGQFDGKTIPHGDKSFDCVLLVDVLHHSDDALRLLHEADRVAQRFVVIKDHILRGIFAEKTLRFMDDIGNKRFGVALPYRFMNREEWQAAFDELRWDVVGWKDRLGIYPWPVSLLFERKLHFLGQFQIKP